MKDNEPIVISREAALSSGKEIEGYLERLNTDDSDVEHPSGYFTQLAMNQATAPLKAEIEKLKRYLERANWRSCDIPACNCNGYHNWNPTRAEIEEPLKEQLHSLSQQNEQLKSEIEDNERWQKEVLSDFKIQYDDHKQGIRLAFTQWMSDKLSSTPADIAKKWVSREVLERCKDALWKADNDIREHLQVAKYNLRGEMHTGDKVEKPNPPLLVHEAGIKTSEAVRNILKEALTLAQKELEKV